MNRILKETIKDAKGLQRKGIIYLDDSIGMGAEVNHQVIAILVEDLNILMVEEKYEILKSDKEELVNEMALSSFKDEDFVSDVDIDLKKHIIRQFIDIDNPFLIGNEYYFVTKYGELGELYTKALIQIEEGKFQNCIF